MLIIPIKDGENIDKALKRFKRKFDKTGVMRSLRERKYFVKPSIEHRSKILKARHIQRLKDQFIIYFISTS
jgi:small subunit ribosomal protein S21